MYYRYSRYLCVYKVRVSPALHGSLTIRHFKHGDPFKIHDRIISYFYIGLSHYIALTIFSHSLAALESHAERRKYLGRNKTYRKLLTFYKPHMFIDSHHLSKIITVLHCNYFVTRLFKCLFHCRNGHRRTVGDESPARAFFRSPQVS